MTAHNVTEMKGEIEVERQSVTDPQVDLCVMTNTFSVGEAEGLQQAGLLAVQEQSPPDGLLLLLLHTVQLDLHHEAWKHTHTQHERTVKTHIVRTNTNMHVNVCVGTQTHIMCMPQHTHTSSGKHHYSRAPVWLSVQNTD